MLRLSRFAIATLVLLAVCAAATADLGARVERAVRSAPLKTATVGVSIRDGDANAELVAIHAARPMIPASNMKLLTTGAALHILGPDFAFRTKLLRDGDRLIILGDGDPGFGDPDLLELMPHQSGKTGIDADAFLNFWIAPVKEAGIRSVRELVVDDRIFDREYVHPTWPAEQLNRRYCAQVSGFNFHANVLHFFPQPTGGARPDVSRFTPCVKWLEVANSATSRADGDNTAWIARAANSNRMHFHGNVKTAYRAPVPVTVHDMPSFFARLFADRLSDAGVRTGSWGVSELHDPQVNADRAQLIGPIITTSISTVLTRCNRDSNNLYAEALMKRAGAAMTKQPGSWENGRAAVQRALNERLRNAPHAQSVVIADGSGLSRDNRVSPATLTAWLNTFHRDGDLGPVFIASLAEPGSDGTLRNRFRSHDLKGMRVQAKSGYISGVSTLSGYVTAPDGRCKSFSVMVNDIPDGAVLQNARRLQEEVVAIIAADFAATHVQLGSD